MNLNSTTKTVIIGAMQATGLRCIFGYRKGDRHIQSRIVELMQKGIKKETALGATSTASRR